MLFGHSKVNKYVALPLWHVNTYDVVWWPLAVFFLAAASFRELPIYSFDTF
jgi:hypothetical protein